MKYAHKHQGKMIIWPINFFEQVICNILISQDQKLKDSLNIFIESKRKKLIRLNYISKFTNIERYLTPEEYCEQQK